MPGDELIDVDHLLEQFSTYKDDHAVHETLNGHTMLQAPFVLHHKEGGGAAVKAVVRFGRATRGHPQLVHGGIAALIFDNLFGWAMFLGGTTHVFTANLQVDYVKPLPCDTVCLVSVGLDRREGRKLYLRGELTSLDGGVTYQRATSLFIIPRPGQGVVAAAAAAAPASDGAEAPTAATGLKLG
ncbi:unnamed protein product [Phaeothamnion confervicola]